MIPLHIVYRDFPPSDAVTASVQEHVEKLEQFFDHIISCRVAIGAPHRHSQRTRIYHIHIQIHIPRHDIVVNHEPENNAEHADIYLAIRDAFRAAERQLEVYARKMRGHIKESHAAPHGRVSEIHHGEDYGFLQSQDGRDIYFHRNSVLNNQFDELEIGTEVRFSEESGLKGPQVTSMSIVGKNGGHIYLNHGGIGAKSMHNG